MIVSLLDSDTYKFTMQQFALHHFPSTEVEYKLIVRSKVDLRPYKKKIETEIDNLCNLRFLADELDYLRTIRFMKPDYVNFLEDFRLKRRHVKVYEENGQLAISIKGEWVNTILFEVPTLAIISEVYCRANYSETIAFEEGYKRLEEKTRLYLKGKDIRITDFGTRRRYSQAWHETVVKYLSDYQPQFWGTSNLYLAKKFNLKPIGTMAHEFIQIGMGLETTQLAKSQKYMLEKWAEEYRGDLGYALTDTIGMDAFLQDFDLYLAKLYDGCRHDSGDPILWGEKLIAHYKKLRIDPMTKSAVFSDNLTFQRAAEIQDHFRGRILCSFGIGTNITNDVGFKPLSIVIKLVRVNGNPVAKISDEPEKAICEDKQFLNYLKKVYGLPYGEFNSAEEYFAAVSREEAHD